MSAIKNRSFDGYSMNGSLDNGVHFGMNRSASFHPNGMLGLVAANLTAMWFAKFSKEHPYQNDRSCHPRKYLVPR